MIIKNVIKFRILMAGLLALCVLSANTISAQSVDDLIAERIKAVGEVCLAGDACAGGNSQTTASTGGASGEFDAAATYQASCNVCHATGMAGAPKLGQAADWTPRLAKGMDTLVENAVNGINAMPAKGMCMTCSNDDLRAVVQYMLDNSQ